MNKFTILLIIIAILGSGIGGFILGAQNSQMVPSVSIANNTTSDNYSSYNDKPVYTKNTTKKSTVVVKKNTTPSNPPKTSNNTTGK